MYYTKNLPLKDARKNKGSVFCWSSSVSINYGWHFSADSPDLKPEKSASPATYDHIGQIIMYMYLVTNSGEVKISEPYPVTDNKTVHFNKHQRSSLREYIHCCSYKEKNGSTSVLR